MVHLPKGLSIATFFALWYTFIGCRRHSIRLRRKEVSALDGILVFLSSVAAGIASSVASQYICQWLDKFLKDDDR